MTDDTRISKALKTITHWSNRTNDAYAMGEAPWAHQGPGGCYLMSLVSRRLNAFGNNPHGWEMAAKAVERISLMRGINPRRHRHHPVVTYTVKVTGQP